MNEIKEFKDDLKNEFGAENNVQLLVAFKKAEMEHALQMEKIELERERMQNDQVLKQKSIQSGKTEQLAMQLDNLKSKIEQEQQKSEQLIAIIEKLDKNNSLLSARFESINSENNSLELNEKLSTLISEQIDSYLELDEIPITLDDANEVLEDVEQTIKKFKKWIKNNNQKKSDYVEVDILKKIRDSLYEMANEFEESEEEEITFSINPKFKKELKEREE